MNIKNLDSEDKLLIGAGVVSLGVLGFFWYKTKKQAKEELLTLDTPIAPVVTQPSLPSVATPPYVVTSVTPLNKSLILKVGSRGNEVKALQQKLGVASDGIFGNITQGALLKVKGVTQISLNAFEGIVSQPAKVVPRVKADVAYKKGQRIMVNVRTGFTAQNVSQKADGSYFTDGSNVFTLLGYGDEIGIIKSVLIRTDGLVRYVVEGKVLGFSRLLWVAHNNVKPIQ